MNRVHIFKPGKYMATNGQTYEFTEAMLQASAAAYDPQLHEAPIVLGHPKHDDPAYGWISKLEFADGQLWGNPDQVDPGFAELHRGGRYKKRSASFYSPDDPRNPVPGVFYLRHLGVLGAQPPAVKGLKAANFADGEAPVTLEFGDWNDRTIARVLRKMKNFFIEQFGKDKADQLIDEWDLEEITTEALRPEPVKAEPVNPEFGEPPRKDLPMRLTPEEIAAKEAELVEREAALGLKEAAGRKAADAAFAEQLVKDGKLLPQHKPFVTDFLEAIEGNQVEVAFSEGKKVSPREAFCQFLEDLGSHPLFKEMTREPETTDKDTASFAEPLTDRV
ncbi:MAG: hypothetical protein AB7D06_17210 [Pedobacter sp.]